jgi:Tfp pilus assembly protein PilF
MNKTKFTLSLMTATLLMVTGVKAQSLQEGIQDLYSDRVESAKAVFEKLVASNPNNIEATYWLGQAFLKKDDIAGAKSVYDKALTTSANAPLLLVGKGQVDLEENKIQDARQRFESALTISKGRKGDDPEILNAVGKAITEVYDHIDKKGDINFAVEKLQAAAQANVKDVRVKADILLNLANALRKQKPGENGGEVFKNLQEASRIDPSYPVPYYRNGMLFQSQRNWDMFVEYMNSAIAKDPRFAPAYYELTYYYMRVDVEKAKQYAQKFKESADADPQNAYLEYSMDWALKNYDKAIAGAKDIIAKTGGKHKAKVHKLLADSYVAKGDTVSAKQHVDEYFAKEKSEEIKPLDYTLKANIYSAIPGQESVALQSFLDGIKSDTTEAGKLDILKEGIELFRKKQQAKNESALYAKLLEIKPKPTINDLFYAAYANYKAGQFGPSYDLAKRMTTDYPDQEYGWEWKYNAAIMLDTAKMDSLAIPAANEWLTFIRKDSVKYAAKFPGVYGYLVQTYNKMKDYENTVVYLGLLKDVTADPARKESLQSNIDQLNDYLKKLKAQPRPAGAGSSGSK